ncbi:MAG: ABC transporter ATP-binding protein [Clostridia bacterium]|nr:ABC transporter ATP-binding protein [Clostridia bacterium]
MKSLLKYLKGYYKESVLAPAFKCLEAIFELLVPLAVAQIVDVGVRQVNHTRILQMCGVMIALGVIGLICALSAQFFAARAAVGFATKLRSSLFAHIQSFSYATTDRLGTSTLITRMTGDVNAVQTGINMFLRLFMRSPFIVFGAMVMAFTIDVKLALIFAIVIPVLAVVVFGIMLITIPIYKNSQSALDRLVGKVRGNYNGTRVVRAFNKESDEIHDFDERNQALTRIQRFAGGISALMNPLTYVIINAAVIFLIQRGSLAVDSGRISQGELIALYNYMSQILVELIKLASLIITLNKAAASAHRISDVFATQPDEGKQISRKSDATAYALVFDRVSFRYHADGDEALSDISFSVKPGETVGIIGGTGSGKTTLANLIPGFYTPSSGNVFVNGKNTALYHGTELTDMFGIVPQKSVLFKGTIRSNLQWGAEDADDDAIWKSLELAQAKEFVAEKELGLDEPVLQGGSNFSGGQKQRLTIARALLRRPRFLILDDSASALDYATEAKLRTALSHLEDKPTLFIISQRTSSIMHADQILVLDDGELVGAGTHQELLARCEIYREIYRSQFPEGGDAE